MRETLQTWINAADNVRHLRLFSIDRIPVHLSKVLSREDDYYISLVGELFRSLNEPSTVASDWAQLGNAFLQFSAETHPDQLAKLGISNYDPTLFAAAAFYFGNYPASACLTMRQTMPPANKESLHAACFDFLSRPYQLDSKIAIQIMETLLEGDSAQLDNLISMLQDEEVAALANGPERWIAAKLLNRLMDNFRKTNLRTILPDGHQDFWNPLVKLLINRKPSTWEFFPSQIEAIHGGLLSSSESFSLQMPTGAGKTTLCETLLFWHLKSHINDVAVMVVPYRSLAAELRETLVRSLNSLDIAARCAYGGTVPSGNEIHDLSSVRALVATPESLIGLLGADQDFAKRIALVICDEGHLLDSGGRGIGLELLLARLRARRDRPIRFVFMSAIVPNIEEINAWLGGTDDTVIRSTYKPATAEYAVLRPIGTGTNTVIELKMHPHEPKQRQFTIDHFLDRKDFEYHNQETRRVNTYNFSSTKTQVIAAARKALPMGATAIFAMNKAGDQGAIGIAESLVRQLEKDLPLPKPIDFTRENVLKKNIAYLQDEYGLRWIGTESLRRGIVLHHGDIPQETREVLESLIRSHVIKLIICTSTLAEGVNLPIRTLILYSVQRRDVSGKIQNMLARDIKNLIGRAGRAGINTKGLVICAKPEQWQHVQPVALSGAGEAVKGALQDLIVRMTDFLTQNRIALNNDFLEANSIIHPIIDGVDATLIELLSNEIGNQEFVALAEDLADQTFAARQLSEKAVINLKSIFAMRATRLVKLREDGKITWSRETGAKVRLIDSVEQHLLPLRPDWQLKTDPLDEEIRQVIFNWAWLHSELRETVKECFRLDDSADVDTVKDLFFEIARLWMNGLQFKDISDVVNLPIDELLSIHARGITYSLQTLVEQGISLLSKRLETEGIKLAEGVANFPEHLRFGLPTAASRFLAISGLRHRKACVYLGEFLERLNIIENSSQAKILASVSLKLDAANWRKTLGDLIYEKTLSEVSSS